MSKLHLHRTLALALSGLVVLIALLNLNAAVIGLPPFLVEAVTYALLTAFATALSVGYGRGDLNVSHTVGMVAFLSLPASAAPVMLWAVFRGGLLGGAAFLAGGRLPWRRARRDQWESGLYMLARTVLPFVVSSQLYLALGGPLPLNLSGLSLAIGPLLVYALVYFGLYFAIFSLQLAMHPLAQRGEVSGWRLALALALPMPFAIAAAPIARADQSLMAFALSSAGIALTAFAIAAISSADVRLRQQVRELQALQALTDALRGNLNLEVLLHTLHSQVRTLFDARAFAVALKDDQEQIVFPLVMRDGSTLHERPDDEALIGYVMRTQQPWLIAKDVQAQCAARGLSLGHLKSVSSWMGVPLVAQNHIIGVLAVAAADDAHFNANDLNLLLILAASASIAIDNARLYQQRILRAEQLALLNQVSNSLSRSLSTEVLDATIMAAGMIADANAITLSLWQGDQWRLEREMGLNNRPAPPLLMRFEAGVRAERIIVRDRDEPHAAASRSALEAHGKRSAIELPLISQDVPLGVLAFYYDEYPAWSSDQLDLLEAFVAQAAQAIQNALKHVAVDRDLEKRIAQLTTLAVLGRQLGAETDIDTVGLILLTRAVEAGQAPYGALFLWDGQGWHVHVQQGYREGMLTEANRLGRGALGEALAEGESLLIEDVATSLLYSKSFAPHVRSAMLCPLLKGAEVLGALVLESERPHAFDESQLQLITQMMNQGAIALSSASLFRRVREARDNLQVILDAMEEAIILITTEGRVAMANPRVTMLGLRPAEILFAMLDSLIGDHPLDFARRTGFKDEEPLRALLVSLRARQWQGLPTDHFSITHGQTVLSVQRQALPVYDELGQLRGAMLVFYDKTEEAELANSRESFTQMLVHDLKSPLSAVMTSLRLLQELVPRTIEHYELIHKTTETSRRALKTVVHRVDGILDVAKLESGESYLNREIVPLRPLIEAAYAEVAPIAQELEVVVHIDLDEGLPPLDVDGDKVERLILNLMDNALKYTPSQSEIWVRASLEPTFIKLTVLDQGQGVPDEYKTRLFDRFVQIAGTPVVRRGVGLGLAFCRLVAEAHGGRIWVEDNPQGGSAFCVTLPMARLG